MNDVLTRYGGIERTLHEQMLTLAERMAGIGYWIVDLKDNRLMWSEEVYRIHGETPVSYKPELESALAYYHPDDVDGVNEAVGRAIETKEPFEFECRIVRKNGDVRIVTSKSAVQVSPDGEAIAVFGTFQDVTSLRETEAQLTESIERYDVAIRGSNVGLFDWNLRNNELYWSPRFKAVVGIDDDEFTPHLSEFQTRLHPDDHDEIMAAVGAHLQERKPYDVEYRLRRQDGSYVWIHATGQAVWDEDGTPLRMAGSIADISEQKREQFFREHSYDLLTDEKLSTNEQIQQLLRLGLDYLELDTGIVSEIAGNSYTVCFVAGNDEIEPGTTFPLDRTYCSHTLNSQSVTRFAHAGDSPIASHPCYETFGLEAYIGAPIRIRGETCGTVNFTSVKPRTQGFSAADISMTAMLSQWITYKLAQQKLEEEQVQSRAAIERQQQELDLIFRLVPARIWFKDDKNRILRLNKPAADSMGMSVEDAEGADTYDLFPEMAAKYHEDDLAVIESGEPLTDIVEEYTPLHGERGWVSTDKVPYVDKATGQRNLVVVSQDITRLMRAQADLEERTAELQKSNRDLDDFAYIASHDLRTPMRGIESLADLIAADIERSADSETLKNLALLRNRITRLDRMLEDMLTYSRAGKDSQAAERVDCTQLVNETAKLIDNSNFSVVIGPDLPILYVPKTGMQQVFLNLLNNAMEHHDNEQGTVTVSSERHEDSLVISVTDDGPGIEDAYKSQIFGMFETLRRNDNAEGSGMGLSIVKRLVESMGGSIDVGDAAGRGSVFRISLPKSVEFLD